MRQLQVQAGHDAAARDELLDQVRGFEERARQDAADKKRLQDQVKGFVEKVRQDAIDKKGLEDQLKGFEEKARQDAVDKKGLEDQLKGFEERARQDAIDKKGLEEKNGDLQKEVETAKGCMVKVAEKMQVFVNIIIPKYYRLNIISQMFRQVATVSLNSCREETKIRALRNLR